MMSKSIIFENFFVFVCYFSDIPLLIRVKTLILRVSLKKYFTRKGFLKNQRPLIKDKTKKEVLKKW